MTGAAQLAGACAVLLSVALLCVTRIGTALLVCSVQSLLAAAALGMRGWGPAGVALLAFVLNGVAVPMILRRMMDRPGMTPSIALRGGAVASWLATLVLLVVAVASFTQVTAGDPSETLALGSSIVLFGLLLMAQRSHPLTPALGLLSSQNGLVLVAITVPHLPLPALLVVAVPLLPALLVANNWLRQ